jgi:uncharacterized protein
MTRDEALVILKKYLTNENLIKHCLACEATMKALYDKLQTDPQSYSKQIRDKWGITGLLHDADYELSKGHPQIHGLLLFEKEPNKFPIDIEYAIKAHNPDTEIEPQSPLDWAIRCCDQLTGIIVACALIHPSRKLEPLTVDFVLKRLGEKSFAKGAKREPILQCEEKLLIPLREFVEITLKAMQGISNELGL